MQPKIYQANEHQLDENLIDTDALFIVQRLREAGFETYIVGGSVRDLLSHRIPKDFDIATSAKPEQIKRVFLKNCLLIGRRFRLAHIRFGHKVIEVATFRTGDDDNDLIVHDNQWGSAEEDVLRRDFTINGLCYDPVQKCIIDYVGGWKDLKEGVLKTIGDPKRRFRQDPVRMIRLLKFRARMQFQVDPDAYKALLECRDEIIKSSPARVLEELLRMLESGASAPFFHELDQAGFLEMLLPCISYFLLTPNRDKLYTYLEAADRYILSRSHHVLDRAVLMGNLLYPLLEQEVLKYGEMHKVTPHIGDITLLATSLTKAIITTSFPHFPKRLSALMSYILATQYRFTPLSGKRHHHPKIMQNKEFALALDLFKIRASLDRSLEANYLGWRDLYKQYERPHHFHQRHHGHHSHPNHSQGYSHNHTGFEEQSDVEEEDLEEESDEQPSEVVEGETAPKKRKKFRRKFPRKRSSKSNPKQNPRPSHG